MSETSVLVVGGGGSGMAAALSASETGANVVLLERTAELGGATGMAIGSYSVAGTPHQRDAGIEDSTDAHVVDAEKFVRQAAESPRHVNFGRKDALDGRDQPALRRFMVESGAETFDWLRSHGVEYDGPHPEPPHRVPRMHNVQPNTDAYADVLGDALDAAGVTVELETEATSLLTEEGRVVGVRTTDGDYRADSVVLAAGGFVADRDLRREFTTDASAPPISEHGSGAGHRLARAVGAELVNMDLQWLSFRVGDPLWTEPDVPALVDAGAVLVDGDGERYVDEERDYDQVFDATHEFAEGECYVVFDERVAEEFSAWPNYVSTFPGIAYGYVEDYADTDYLASADTADDLADVVGMDALPETLADAEAAGRDETTDLYGRTTLCETEPPYYALGPMHPYSLLTDGGVRVNTRLEALDEEGTPIPGLYAVGDTAGAPLRLGHGHHHLWLFTSGRRAGVEAARSR